MKTDVRQLIVRLLKRGDLIEIQDGRLNIEAASGNPVPDEWMGANGDSIVSTILSTLSLDAFHYRSYTTKPYEVNDKGRRSPGLCLQIVSVVTGEQACVFFNVRLDRARNTKGGNAGDPLPKGQFRLHHRKGENPKQHNFYKFWTSTNVPLPRLSAFHDRMGNLREILFTAPYRNREKQRLNATEIRAVSLSCEQIKSVFLSDNILTSHGQTPDKGMTNVPDKESMQTHKTQGIQPNLTTCENNYSNKVIRKHSNTGNILPITKPPIKAALIDDDLDHKRWYEELDGG
jgi:hypothetical protein